LTRLDWGRRVRLVSDDELGPHRVQVVEALLHVQTLDRVDVPLRDIGDSGEDVHPFVVELAARVVVPPIDHLRQVSPRVRFRVEYLSLASGEIDIFAGA